MHFRVEIKIFGKYSLKFKCLWYLFFEFQTSYCFIYKTKNIMKLFLAELLLALIGF